MSTSAKQETNGEVLHKTQVGEVEMDYKAVFLTIIFVLVYIVVASILSALAGGSMLKLFTWSIRMFYALIPTSFFLTLYLVLNSDRSFNFLLVFVNLVILLVLLLVRGRLKKMEPIESYIEKRIMMLILVCLVGFPILHIYLFIEVFKGL
ncbi:hypothetical protein J15TS10_23150 [Paenibacillus woosongensis]|uniref:Uncharacterized protein n=2 Tax=Paenibacillus TaxID=44249 RepID=A0ABQ4MR62_9BACL|nr:hypothetical protein J15TS10_23150 [Paenibacillus woosongensis]